MDQTPNQAAVRVATPAETAALSAVLADAFWSDPLLNWMLPQRLRRQWRRRQLFTIQMRLYAFPDGRVFTATGTDGPAGACMVIPPRGPQSPRETNLRDALLMLGICGMQLPRMTRAMALVERHHPAEPHYYFPTIGVRPELQGRGLGSALMRPTLERCDAEQVSAYLEASTRRSAALYERLGFVHVGELQMPDGGPTLWRMRRPPA